MYETKRDSKGTPATGFSASSKSLSADASGLFPLAGQKRIKRERKMLGWARKTGDSYYCAVDGNSGENPNSLKNVPDTFNSSVE